MAATNEDGLAFEAANRIITERLRGTKRDGAAMLREKHITALAHKHHTPDQEWQIDLYGYTRAIEKAAREAVLKELTEAFHESIRRALREGS
jgi:hypothetical protein